MLVRRKYMENMQRLRQISKDLVGEETEAILEKAYCTMLFTSNYVIKLFCRNKREYDEKALNYEYLWDKNMPYLEARFVKNIMLDGLDVSALILKRMPYSSNMLYKLSHDEMANEEIDYIGKLIKDLICNTPKIEISPEILYKNYIHNLNLQIKKLDKKINSRLEIVLKKIYYSHEVFNIFRAVNEIKSAALVHGNLFSGNIFFYRNELIVIDPISYNHVARRSFPHMDMATFLVDIRILKNDQEYFDIYRKIICDMKECEIILMHLYLLLKLFVRLRFAYLENDLRDEYSEFDINEVIIANSPDILAKEMEYLLSELKVK